MLPGMAYYEVTPASNSMQPDLHKRNHVAQTWCAAVQHKYTCNLLCLKLALERKHVVKFGENVDRLSKMPPQSASPSHSSMSRQ